MISITGQLTRTTANPDGTASIFAPGTAVLSELISKLPENERYSYNFDGNAQALDHILVSNNLFDSAQFDIVHINSEFIDQISDHDPSVSSLVMSRSAAIATAGNDVFDQAAYTAKFGVRGSLAGNDTIDGLGGDDRIAAGGGNDAIDGGLNGAAGDIAVYSGARSNYTVTQQAGSFVITDNRAGSSDGIDTVTNVERFEFADRTLSAAQLLDATGPVLTAATPADNATAVAAGNNIVLTFDEAVAAGTGSIVISNGAGDTRTIAIGDASQVTISGNTVTINPTADLAAGATYDVTLASGVITDAAGNAFAGIAQNRSRLHRRGAADLQASDPARVGFRGRPEGDRRCAALRSHRGPARGYVCQLDHPGVGRQLHSEPVLQCCQRPGPGIVLPAEHRPRRYPHPEHRSGSRRPSSATTSSIRARAMCRTSSVR